MNKQLIILIIIILILGLAVGGLTWFYRMRLQSLVSKSANYSAPAMYSQRLLEERTLSSAENEKYGLKPDQTAKLKVLSSPYNPDARITIIEIIPTATK